MKRIIALVMGFGLLVALNGCQGKPEADLSPSPDPSQSPAAAQTPEETAAPDETSTPETIFPRSFLFSSGAGGWGTLLDVAADGSFAGTYHDSNMGSSGEEYPYGTVYYCDFTGTFSQPEMVNDYTYTVTLESLEYASEPGEVSIEDGIRYISSDAYGIDGGEEFLIYLPGAPIDQLPEEFMLWVGWLRGGETLRGYGLYNVNREYGLGEYEY